jgi:hypothetical protein
MSLAQPNSVFGRPPPARLTALEGHGEEQGQPQIGEMLVELEHATVFVENGPRRIEAIVRSPEAIGARSDAGNVFAPRVEIEQPGEECTMPFRTIDASCLLIL